MSMHFMTKFVRTCQVVRERNMYDAKDELKLVAPNGNSLLPYTIPTLWNQLKAKADYDKRYKVRCCVLACWMCVYSLAIETGGG